MAPSWYWMMELIDKGFTEKQIFEEFSMSTIAHFRTYGIVKAGALEEHYKQIRGSSSGHSGSIGQRVPGTTAIKSQRRSAW